MRYGDNGIAQDLPSPGSDGLTVTVKSDGDIASRTVYVVSNPHLVLQRHTPKGVVPGKFSYSPHLVAEVLFDNPNCEEATASPTTWAVALNFKSGDQTDKAGDPADPTTDFIVGVTCQFVAGGNVNFHGTEYDPTPSYAYPLVGTANYADYHEGTETTKFLLRVNLSRTATSTDATASLTIIRPDPASDSGYEVTYIPPVGKGILNETVSPITDNVQDLSEAESNVRKLTAAGIAVVNFKGKSTVSVRLLEFNLLYYNYWYLTKL
jgi:hypothetical protein